MVLGSSDFDEVASFQDLATTLVALAKSAAAEPVAAPPRLSADVASCPSCGAPLTPSADATTRCVFCAAEAPMPEALRREVVHDGELAASRGATSRAIERLERWPRAATVNRVLALAVVPLVFGWPAAAVLASEYFQSH